MARRRAKMQMENFPSGPLRRYWGATHVPLNCLVFIVPFLIVYEVGVAGWGTDLLARTRLQGFLQQFGATAAHLSAVLVVAVLLVWHALGRRRWKIDGAAVALMYAESLLLALPLLGLGILGGRMAAAADPALLAARGHSLTSDLLAAVGAGIYEEFLFRLVALNLLGLVLLDILELQEDLGQVLAMLASAVLFSLFHPQPMWHWGVFIYYFVAGCYLALIYMGRGFGVAVGTHIFFDVIVGLIGPAA
jgi:membrane protease YdiL (CAAX protease family)